MSFEGRCSWRIYIEFVWVEDSIWYYFFEFVVFLGMIVGICFCLGMVGLDWGLWNYLLYEGNVGEVLFKVVCCYGFC